MLRLNPGYVQRGNGGNGRLKYEDQLKNNDSEDIRGGRDFSWQGKDFPSLDVSFE
jgi:hypothetical protein